MCLCVQSRRISHDSKIESELYVRDPRRAQCRVDELGLSSQPWFEWKQRWPCSLARFQLIKLSYMFMSRIKSVHMLDKSKQREIQTPERKPIQQDTFNATTPRTTCCCSLTRRQSNRYNGTYWNVGDKGVTSCPKVTLRKRSRTRITGNNQAC